MTIFVEVKMFSSYQKIEPYPSGRGDNPCFFVDEEHNRDLDPRWWLELGYVELEDINVKRSQTLAF